MEMEKLRKQIEADLDRTHFDQFRSKINMPILKDVGDQSSDQRAS